MCQNRINRMQTLGKARRFLRLSAFMAEQFDKLKQELQGGARLISLSGLTSVSAKAFLLSKLSSETGKAFTIVTGSNTELDDWKNDLEFFRSQVEDRNS